MKAASRPQWVCEIEVRPAFHDLDPMDIVWHGHYVKYLELARCALLDRLDYGYRQMRDSGYAWPVVDMRLKYVAPLSFDQRVIVRAEITEWENRLRFDYLLSDAASGARLTKGYTVHVAVELATREMQFVCPPVLLQRLGIAP